MKIKILFMAIVVAVLSLAGPQTSDACSCDCKVLASCYSSCKSQFSPVDALVFACYGGCVIGCATHPVD